MILYLMNFNSLMVNEFGWKVLNFPDLKIVFWSHIMMDC